MASISKGRNGHKRIQFVAGDGSRKTIYLGLASMKQAEEFKLKVQALVAASIIGAGIDDEVSRWLAGLDDKMHTRLENVGLVKDRTHGKATLEQLLDDFFKHLNVKPITALGYQSTRTALLGYFGADTPIRDIEALQADQWRATLKDAGLAEATIGKRVKLARQMFRQGVRWKMLVENAFADVKAGSPVNKARQRFISKEVAQKVLAACPDSQWRLLFALSRFGGLRCPSEHLALKWGDVDWEHGRIRVTCSKTEHHEGRGERFVPMFPELRPHLQEAFDEAEPGTEFVITRYRNRNANLRTQFQRIIRKAGLTPWPRLFHNLRSTRQTELAESFPAHVVCSWIGNTERVAGNHYLQTTDAHFARAIEEPKEKATQNQTQKPAETPCNDVQRHLAESQNPLVLLGNPASCAFTQDGVIAATGLEPVTRGL